jgi:hypothetical protein
MKRVRFHEDAISLPAFRQTISYAKHYDMNDVASGESRREKPRGGDGYVKPRMMRSQTYAY